MGKFSQLQLASPLTIRATSPLAPVSASLPVASVFVVGSAMI